MISKSLLWEDETLKSIRWKGGSDFGMEEFKSSIEKACMEHGLNVIVSEDIITSGRLFDKSTTECIRIKNAEHPTDYFEEVISMKKQGIYAFFDFYCTGTSKNFRRIADGEREHSTITGSIIAAIKKATVSNDAKEAESNYYAMLYDAIGSIFQ